MSQAETMSHEGPTVCAAQKRRYRWFIAVECVLVLATALACAGLWNAPALLSDWVAVLLGVLCLWHVIAVIICLAYLVGTPIIMSLSPLIPSAESRAFGRLLRTRPVLNDDEFFDRYYAESDISRQIVARTRHALRDLDWRMGQVIPGDDLGLLDDEFDFADAFDLLQEEFVIRFTRQDWAAMDGTLDSLIRLVQARVGPVTAKS